MDVVRSSIVVLRGVCLAIATWPLGACATSHGDVAGGSGESQSATVGPEGGSLNVGGATVTIPAGALESPTEIRVTESRAPTPDGYTAYSALYVFEPQELTLGRPVSVAIAHVGDDSRAQAFWSRAGAIGYEPIDGVASSRSVSVEVDRFGSGFLADGGARSITAGNADACAAYIDGSVRCWGQNGSGALGDGTTTHRNVPAIVIGLTAPLQVAAGVTHTCAIRASGQLACWGSNMFGALGDGTMLDKLMPVDVPGVSDVVEVALGNGYTCALHGSGEVSCWGRNHGGQLGDGTTEDRASPGVVTGLSDAMEITAGSEHACARRASGQVVCWGANYDHQIGDGTTAERHTGVAVTGLSDATAITATSGGLHTCAQRVSGQIVCWGSNNMGQLGDGTTAEHSTFVAVVGLVDAVEVSAGEIHACARRPTGAVVCWGDNTSYGALGDGTGHSRIGIVAVGGVSDAAELAAGNRHTCLRRAGGGVVCWGAGTGGQLGDGSATNQYSPVEVAD